VSRQDHAPLLGPIASGRQGEQLERGQFQQRVQGIEQFTAPFERCPWEIVQIAAAGNVVLTERIDRFIGADKKVELPVMGAFEIRDGKIAAWRDYFDLGAWTKQAS
jgi:limonene-1,2-epoxide hydrolase